MLSTIIVVLSTTLPRTTVTDTPRLSVNVTEGGTNTSHVANGNGDLPLPSWRKHNRRRLEFNTLTTSRLAW